jgi:hypothetical protein
MCESLVEYDRPQGSSTWCPLAWGSFEDDYPEVVGDERLPENAYSVEELAWGIYYLASSERDYMHVGGLISEVPRLCWKTAKCGRMSNFTISSGKLETFHVVGLCTNVGWTMSMETD